MYVLGHLAIALPFYFHIFQQQRNLHSQLLSAASLSLADSYAQHIFLDHIELNLLSLRVFSINLSLYFTQKIIRMTTAETFVLQNDKLISLHICLCP